MASATYHSDERDRPATKKSPFLGLPYRPLLDCRWTHLASTGRILDCRFPSRLVARIGTDGCRTGGTDRSLNSSCSRVSLWTCGSGSSGDPLGTLRSSWSLSPLGSGRTSWTLVALWTLRTLRPS